MHQEIDNNNRVIAIIAGIIQEAPCGDSGVFFYVDFSWILYRSTYGASERKVKFGGQKVGKFQRAIPLPVSDMKGRISIYDMATSSHII
jgi:hypothetical protein